MIRVAGIFLVLFTLPNFGYADLYPAQFLIPKINTPPLLDGVLSDHEWDEFQEISDFVVWTLDRYEEDPVTAFLGYDDRNIYVAFTSTFGDKALFEKKYEEKQPIDSHLWGRNHVSVQLQNDEVAIHLMAAPALSRTDFKNGDMAWNGDWDFATAVNENNWIAEIKIPFSDFDLEKPPMMQKWNLTLGRSHPAGASAVSWHGKVMFSDDTPVKPIIKQWPQPEPGKNELEFVLNNPGNTVQKVNCEIELIPFEGKPDFINQKGQGHSSQFILPLSGAPVRFTHTFPIPAGEKMQASIPYELPTEGNYYATATCYAEDSSILLRNRGFWFGLTSNRGRLQELTKLAGEGYANCRKKNNLVAKQLASEGENILSVLSVLSSEAENHWTSRQWKEFTHRVDEQAQMIYQYLNKVRHASMHNWEKSADFGVTVTHSLHKLCRDKAYTEPMFDKARISAARNEYESFQLVILPFGVDVQGITLEATDLVSTAGGIIPKSEIEISLVDYHKIAWQPNYVIEDEGWYPDPLMPIEKPINIEGTAISRPLWVTVYVPKGTAAGDYTGQITVKTTSLGDHSIDIDLTVWDFELPTTSHLKTHTWDQLEFFNEFYNVEEMPIEWYLNFCEVLLKNRLSPGFAGVNYLDQKPDAQGKFDFSRVEKVLEFCMERGLTRYSIIQMRKGFYTPEEEKEVYHFIDEYAKFLKERGWLDKGVVEVWDEPTIVRLPAVIQRAKDLRNIDPDLRLQLFAFGKEPYDFWKPEAKQYGLVDLIDVWAPFPLIESPESQAEGKEIWSYFCTLARGNAPNFYIDRPAVYQRTIGWHSWMFGIDAFEHWSTNYFWRNTLEGKPISEKWPNSAWDSRTFMDFHGEGQLIYPGPHGKCIPSMRLEIFRDGLDDYEYLYLLRELVQKCEAMDLNIDMNAYKQLLKVEEYLLVKYPEDLTTTQENTIRHPEQPALFLETREKIARAIEKLQSYE